MFPHNVPFPSPEKSAWLIGGFMHFLHLCVRISQIRTVPDSDLGWEDMYREDEGRPWFDWVRFISTPWPYFSESHLYFIPSWLHSFCILDLNDRPCPHRYYSSAQASSTPCPSSPAPKSTNSTSPANPSPPPTPNSSADLPPTLPAPPRPLPHPPHEKRRRSSSACSHISGAHSSSRSDSC